MVATPGPELSRGGHIAGPEPSPHVRVTVIDRCANQVCPNRAGEGRFGIATIHTTDRGGKRDVVLPLCMPCAEYLSRMVS